MQTRWIPVLVLSSAYAFACGSEDTVPTGAGGAPPDDTWGASDCGTCVEDTCTAEWEACAADPGCAQYLACIQACELSALGNVDKACEEACPIADSSTTLELKSELTFCRLETATACPCGQVSVRDQDCPESVEMEPCWICEDENCCETYAACDADPECDAIGPCVQACPLGDGACEDQCILDHGAGMATFGPRITCLLKYCVMDCTGAAPDPCVTCLIDNCEQSSLACSSNAECYVLQGCVGNCAGDSACIDACEAQYPNGVDLYEAFGLCGISRCMLECG